jgi:hypothetical protein
LPFQMRQCRRSTSRRLSRFHHPVRAAGSNAVIEGLLACASPAGELSEL